MPDSPASKSGAPVEQLATVWSAVRNFRWGWIRTFEWSAGEGRRIGFAVQWDAPIEDADSHDFYLGEVPDVPESDSPTANPVQGLTVSRFDSYLDTLDQKTVIGIDVSEGESDLRFRLADGEAVVWSTEGDCCSESWWADGFEINSLRGATVRLVAEIEMPDMDPNDGRTRQEEDEIHGVRIDTDRGSATFVFRNSSNGYYGGWCSLGSDSGQAWREVEGNDWRA